MIAQDWIMEEIKKNYLVLFEITFPSAGGVSFIYVCI